MFLTTINMRYKSFLELIQIYISDTYFTVLSQLTQVLLAVQLQYVIAAVMAAGLKIWRGK